MIIGGYIIQPIETDEEGNITEVTCISKANLKVSMPQQLMKNFTANEIPRRVKIINENMSKSNEHEN